MAIQKTIKNAKGVACTYHRIGLFNFSAIDNMVYVNLFSYTDETYRETEKQTKEDYHVDNIQVILPPLENDIYSREILYQMIMALPEFEGSTSI